jgi:hypothetical protein
MKQKKEVFLIDVTVPSDFNTELKEADKIRKYTPLTFELQQLWQKSIQIIPVVVGSTCVINKKFNKYLSKLPPNINTIEIQKLAIFGTTKIVRKFIL